MLNRTVDKAGELVKKADEYILNHKEFCIIICVILLLIFIPMLILTYRRAKKLHKRQREMAWEKEEIARIEREINEKSAEEVEMELRRNMRKSKYKYTEDDDPDIYDSTAKIYDVPVENDREQDYEEE